MPSIFSPSILSLILVSSLAGCGGNGSAGVCGDGVVDPGEQCDRGADNGKPDVPCDIHCHSISIPIPQIQVSWGLLQHSPVMGFQGTNCDAVAATGAHVILTGPSRVEEILRCTRYGKLYSDLCPDGADGGTCAMHLKPGDYQVTITLTRGADDQTAVTSAVTTGKTTVVAGPVVSIFVDFELEDFLTSYTGSLQLATDWGRLQTTCGKAMPKVDTESLLLVPAGLTKPVVAMSVAGTKLDGTPAPCFTPPDAVFAEEVRNLPWGPYQLTIKGFSGSPQPSYCGKFDVFVGPSDNTQIWHPFVPAAPPIPDGGIPDGGEGGCP